MQLILEIAPWLLAMGVLLCCSAFFSSSEAALFYLRRRDRRAFQTGNRAQRLAAALLEDPDRLLTAILFWNLVVNVSYFALTSIVSLRLETRGHLIEAGWLTFGALLAIIFLGEMLPKSIAVLWTRVLAALLALPLSVTVRAIAPVLPALQTANLLSRRLLWPSFRPEPYMEVTDLERAVSMSTTDAELLRQEESVLHNIVSLSDMRVDELMRPRTQIQVFGPPVALADLQGTMPRSGYILVTEEDSDEIASAIPLRNLPEIPDKGLEQFAEEVNYVPWCAAVSSALEAMTAGNQRVTVVVNEFGETIGVLTFDDVLDTIFGEETSRSARLMNRESIRQVGPAIWHVTGMTSLRRLYRYFNLDRETNKSVTVGGVMQEMLQRVPEQGDRCLWHGFELHVLDVPEQGQLLVEMTISAAPTAGEEEP